MKDEFPFETAIVTGGAGFVGSHLCDALVQAGIETISIDDYIAGKSENLIQLRDHKNFSELSCDITDMDALSKIIQDIDVIFHQAASKKTVCLRDPRRDLQVNGEGTFNLLELARDRGVKKFVHASTGSVYGEAIYLPQDENHPVAPTSYYGVSKLAGESYVNAFNKLYDLDTTVLRYFHVYGPRQEDGEFGGVVAIFMRKILEGLPLVIFGDGSQERSFTNVDDVVEANLRSAYVPEATGKIYNCASGINVTIQELAEQVTQLAGDIEPQIQYGDWTPGDIRKFEIDNSRICADLGIEFEKDFNQGLEKTWDWFNSRES
ncbi:MAG: NAD-dependent epimerase/dehydratase family protein [Acidimicrobiales bacterium]